MCYVDRLSLEIATTVTDALVLYQGPMSEVGSNEMPEFFSIELRDGYPNVRMNLGGGEPAGGLLVGGANKDGLTKLNQINDGKWHLIEVIKSGMVRIYGCG